MEWEFAAAELAGVIGDVLGLKSLVMVILDPTLPLPIATCVFPVMPENYNEVNNYMVGVQPTLHGGFADKLGPGPGQLTLRGKFWTTRRQVVNYMMPIPVNALGAVRWMRSFADKASGTDQSGKPYRVVLMNWLTNRNWQVEIKQLTIAQDINRNTVWTYALNIELLRPLPSPLREQLEGVFDSLFGEAIGGYIQNYLGDTLLSWAGVG